jgi:hypothetical protein
VSTLNFGAAKVTDSEAEAAYRVCLTECSHVWSRDTSQTWSSLQLLVVCSFAASGGQSGVGRSLLVRVGAGLILVTRY